MAVATKARNTSAATDPRAELIEQRNREQAACEERVRVANEKRQAAEAAVAAHEYSRLVAAVTAAKTEYEVAGTNLAVVRRTANEELARIRPAAILAALESIADEKFNIMGRIGQAFNSHVAPGTRDALIARRNALERAESELNRIAANEIDFAPALAAVIEEVRLLLPPGAKPYFRPMRPLAY